MKWTTGWMWDSINRGIDVNVANGITRTRNNWSLTRYRASDQDYSSAIGTVATSISAVNGGVTETVSAPSVNAVTFTVTGFFNFTTTGAGTAAANADWIRYGATEWRKSTDSNWRVTLYATNYWRIGTASPNVVYYESNSTTSATPPYSATWNVTGSGSAPVPTFSTSGWTDYWTGGTDGVWIETGMESGGQPTYVLLNALSTPNPNLTNVIWLSTVGATAQKWCAAAVQFSDAESGAFIDLECNGTNFTDGYAIATTTGYTSINGIVFTGYDEFWSDATATLGTTTAILRCVADNQSYSDKGVDWFTQTQTWEYRDSWVRRTS